MPSPEVFFLHLSGEQRGPYTILQIDHLLNSGLIPVETLFWREGLEQWLPVTDLVELRRKSNPWKKVAIAAGLLVPILLLGTFFGPTVIDAWRETTASDYTIEDAYWRARDAVRAQGLPPDSLVAFEESESAAVELLGGDRARVILRGQMMPKKGPAREVSWRVDLQYDPGDGAWSKSQTAMEPAAP